MHARTGCAYLRKLRDDAELILRLKRIEQDYNIGMIQLALNVDLLPKIPEVLFRLAVLGNVFESHNLAKSHGALSTESLRSITEYIGDV